MHFADNVLHALWIVFISHLGQFGIWCWITLSVCIKKCACVSLYAKKSSFWMVGR